MGTCNSVQCVCNPHEVSREPKITLKFPQSPLLSTTDLIRKYTGGIQVSLTLIPCADKQHPWRVDRYTHKQLVMNNLSIKIFFCPCLSGQFCVIRPGIRQSNQNFLVHVNSTNAYFRIVSNIISDMPREPSGCKISEINIRQSPLRAASCIPPGNCRPHESAYRRALGAGGAQTHCSAVRRPSARPLRMASTRGSERISS